MRIALFCETYMPYVNGVVTHIKILKEGLENMGHQVLIVTANTQTRRHFEKEGVLHCPAKKIKRIYGYGLASPVSPRRLRLVREWNPDVIHIHQEFGIGFSGFLIAKVLKKPIVYTLHTMYDEYILYFAPKLFVGITKAALHGYEKMLGKNSDVLVGPSPKVQEFFARCGVKQQVLHVPNTVETDLFRPDIITEEQKLELRRSLKIPENAAVGCFVGRLGNEKSIDVLLNFFAQTRGSNDETYLVIVGSGPEEQLLKSLCSKLGLDDRVRFTGRIEHTDIPPYYASCDFFVTASLSEMHSISMLEAMASGLMVFQRFDEENACQITEGVNGKFFKTAEEMHALFKEVENMTPEERTKRKLLVRESVENANSAQLAEYLVELYQSAKENKDEKRNRRHRRKNTHIKL